MATGTADAIVNGELIHHAGPIVRREKVVHDDGPLAHLFDSARFDHMQRIAKLMAQAPLMPDHLRLDRNKKPLSDAQATANCVLVVNQSFRWGIDPFAAAPETYVVGGKLGFQGKLVAAVINSRAGLVRPLGVKYNSGKGDAFGAVIYGSRTGEIPREAHSLLQRYAEQEDRVALNALDELGVLAVRITVGQAKTDNRMWVADPEQKLFYTGATKWARRHAPEIMLGVVTDDDLDRMRLTREIEPAASPLCLPSGGTRSDQLASMLSQSKAAQDGLQKDTDTRPQLIADSETEELEAEEEPTGGPKGMSYDALADAIKAAKSLKELEQLMDEISISMSSGEITGDGAAKLGGLVEIHKAPYVGKK